MEISEIKTENLATGCVTDEVRPRFSFSLSSERSGAALARARITVGDWRAERTEQLFIPYGGAPLRPFTEYAVKIEAESTDGERAEKTSPFETGIDCLADLLPADLPCAEKLLPPLLFRRVRHVVEECQRVRLVCDAMRAGDMLALGDLLNRSHASLRDLYETTGREADILTAAAREHPACVGSRLTGGGFGGCTVSLVRSDGAEDFEEYACRRYEKETGLKAVCHAADIADGITVTRL